MNQAAEEIETVIVDGYICTLDGEVIGMVEVKPQFTVSDDGSCNWVLERMLTQEAEILSIDETPAVIAARAILLNAESMKKDSQRRLDWLHTRFDPELGEYARIQLEGAKTKTYKTIFGAISLRTVKGGLRVKDKSLALEVARQEGFTNAIKTTEEFQISGLTDAQRELLESKLRALPSNDNSFGGQAFEIKLPTESVTVKTGAEK